MSHPPVRGGEYFEQETTRSLCQVEKLILLQLFVINCYLKMLITNPIKLF